MPSAMTISWLKKLLGIGPGPEEWGAPAALMVSVPLLKVVKS